MKQDRLKEHETLRRMATADDGEALERRAREAEARADDKENRRLWFRPCETCFEIRRAAAYGKDPDYASRLCTRCNARAVKEAAEEVRRVRLDDGARENDDDEDDAPGTNPRTVDALRADLAAAEAAVALSGEECDRLAALDRCAQLRVAIETARVGATREARRRLEEGKEERRRTADTSASRPEHVHGDRAGNRGDVDKQLTDFRRSTKSHNTTAPPRS